MNILATLAKDLNALLHEEKRTSAGGFLFDLPERKEVKREEIVSIEPEEKIVPKKEITPTHSFSEMKALFSKVAPTLSVFESPGFIFLFVPEETEDLPFFEKLKEAISTHIHPAKMVSAKNERELLSFLELPHFKLGLIPHSLYSSFFQDGNETEYHKLTHLPQTNSPLILLHEAKRYQSDLSLKKELWNQLKSAPILSWLRSSSTLA